MPALSARVTPEARAQIDALSRRWKLGNADTLRRLVVLGVGGTMREVGELNVAMRERRDAAEAFFGERRPGYREHAGRERAPVVRVRLPASWAARVKKAGGLAIVLTAGVGRT